MVELSLTNSNAECILSMPMLRLIVLHVMLTVVLQNTQHFCRFVQDAYCLQSSQDYSPTR
jgi:hypothetical protein